MQESRSGKHFAELPSPPLGRAPFISAPAPPVNLTTEPEWKCEQQNWLFAVGNSKGDREPFISLLTEEYQNTPRLKPVMGFQAFNLPGQWFRSKQSLQ